MLLRLAFKQAKLVKAQGRLPLVSKQVLSAKPVALLRLVQTPGKPAKS
jgi:hypothetical protein